jgi:hypothetical protein
MIKSKEMKYERLIFLFVLPADLRSSPSLFVLQYHFSCGAVRQLKINVPFWYFESQKVSNCIIFIAIDSESSREWRKPNVVTTGVLQNKISQRVNDKTNTRVW